MLIIKDVVNIIDVEIKLKIQFLYGSVERFNDLLKYVMEIMKQKYIMQVFYG